MCPPEGISFEKPKFVIISIGKRSQSGGVFERQFNTFSRSIGRWIKSMDVIVVQSMGQSI